MEFEAVANLKSTDPNDPTVNPPVDPFANRSIVINDDAEFTNKKTVTLQLRGRGATEMYLTNDPTCSQGGVWEPFAQSKLWDLEQTNQSATVYVSYRGAEGLNEGNCANDTITHDDIPPTLTVKKNAPKLTNQSMVEIEFEANDSLSGLARLDCLNKDKAPISQSCEPSLRLRNLSEGQGLLNVIAFDKAGNQSDPILQTWLVDLTPPKIQINGPAAFSNSQTAAFTLSATDNYSTQIAPECQLDQADFTPCQSTFSRNVSEGKHTLVVKAKDEAGNESMVKHEWTVNLKSPAVELTAWPSPLSNQGIGQFEFRGIANGAPIDRFECSVDNKTAVACTSPFRTTTLTEGPHTFQVIGIDASGNKSSPAVWKWTIDLTAPLIAVTNKPNLFTNSTSASIAFTVTDANGVRTVNCLLDGTTNDGNCPLSKTLSNMSEGRHTYQISATDNAGNAATPVVVSWTVDLQAPTITLNQYPANLTNQKTASFGFEVKDNNPGPITIQCHLDAAAYQLCTNPITFANLTDGVHTLYFKAIDQAGNSSGESTYSWTIDATGPAITFTKIPAALIGQTETVQVEFVVSDSGSGIASVQCGFRSQEASCGLTKLETFVNLAINNTYTYSVIATDKLGNKSSNAVSWTITLDSQPISQTVTVNAYNKADILIVMDNSGSMAPEQNSMATRFSNFFDVIKNLDWQLGIITTDVTSNANLMDGRFVSFSPTTGGPYILNSTMTSTYLNNVFSTTIKMGTYGSGYEQGIAATYRAIERSKTATTDTVSAPNRAFFRSGATLSVVLVSDADESPSAGTSIRNIPENLVSLVKSYWPTKTFSFHSIIVKPGDTYCHNTGGESTSSNGSLDDYGDTYAKLSQLTGGVIGSVCATDYTSQLQSIGQKVVESVKTVTLSCLPVDLNKDGKADVEVQMADGSAPPAFTVSQLSLTFATPLPEGSHKINYRCLK